MKLLRANVWIHPVGACAHECPALHDEFFVQLELTFALALTETLMLADALIDASAAVPAHAMALPPKFADALTTACPVAATFSSALAAN